MDYNQGFPVREAADFQIQRPWVKHAPAAERNLLPGYDLQGFAAAESARIGDLSSLVGSYGGGLLRRNGHDASSSSMNMVQGFDNWPQNNIQSDEIGLSSSGQLNQDYFISHNVQPSMQSFGGVSDGWRQNESYLNLMAFTESMAASRTPMSFMNPMAAARGPISSPGIVNQSVGVEELSVTNTQLLLNGMYPLQESIPDLNSQYQTDDNAYKENLTEETRQWNAPVLHQLGQLFQHPAAGSSVESRTVMPPYSFTPPSREKNKLTGHVNVPYECINSPDENPYQTNVENTTAQRQISEVEQIELFFSRLVGQQSLESGIQSSGSFIPSDVVVPQQIRSTEMPIASSEKDNADLLNIEKSSNLECDGIDLNATPKQKARRKKHRPKVIREGKPARTPKPKTPKPSTPNAARNINPATGRRNYVRKKIVPDCPQNCSELQDGTSNLNNKCGAKTTKRRLDFDLETSEPSHKVHEQTEVVPGNGACPASEFPGQECSQLNQEVEAVDHSSSSRVAFDLFSLVNQSSLAEDSEDSTRNRAEALQFSHVQSASQIMPVSTSQPSSSKLITHNPITLGENINNLTVSNNAEYFESDRGKFLSPETNNSLVKVSKRNNIHDSDIQAHTGQFEGIASVNECLFSMSKKQRLLPKLHGFSPTADSSSSYPSKVGLGNDLRVARMSELLAFTDNQQSQLHDLLQESDRILAFGQTMNNTKLRSDLLNKTLGEVNCGNKTTSANCRELANIGYHGQTMNTMRSVLLNKALGEVNCGNKTTPANCRELANMGYHISSASASTIQPGNMGYHIPSTSLRISEGNNTQDRHIGDKTSPANCRDLAIMGYHILSASATTIQPGNMGYHIPTTPVKTCEGNIIRDRQIGGAETCTNTKVQNRSTKPKTKGRKNNNLALQVSLISQNGNNNDNGGHKSASYDFGYQIIQKTSKKCLSSKTMQERNFNSLLPKAITFDNPIDEITFRLNGLDINEDSPFANCDIQNAIVPYEGGGIMVAYQPKKKRPRPKVDLDPETDRVWRLLMGKEYSNGVDYMDGDKEQWWAEERRVFHGRVDSFIARMHLVQGDRRFSKWKGSVVDSVVGVFLTQNVSDHLSSSAFMALAARFPPKARDNSDTSFVNGDSSVEQGHCIVDLAYESSKCEDHMLDKQLLHQDPPINIRETESASSNESYGSNTGCREATGLKCFDTNETVQEVGFGSPDSRTSVQTTVAGSSRPGDVAERWLVEDVLSSQNSVVSSLNSGRNPLQSLHHYELGTMVDSQPQELLTGSINNNKDPASFTELLRIAHTFQLGQCLDANSCFPPTNSETRPAAPDEYGALSVTDSFLYSRSANANHVNHIPESHSANNRIPSHFGFSSTGVFGLNNIIGSKEKNTNEPSTSSKTNSLANSKIVDLFSPPSTSEKETGNGGKIYLTDSLSEISKLSRQVQVEGECQHLINNFSSQKCSINLDETQNSQVRISEGVELTLKDDAHSSKMIPPETPNTKLKEKKVKADFEKKTIYDWDSLRKVVEGNGPKVKRSQDRMDSIDWNAIRSADVSELSETIRERGMNNMLADRIKDFLDRLVRDHGSIDLEWLRDVEPDKAKDYLLSIRGLGLKSVECVRLLTLHHLAFPVDTNVGRICVRLGWVPLQPLPESLQLHLLELYPVLETIQKYIWPRLCKLDQRTLYELHYQMITFGKVFCTKSKPNCNACPMRAECRHFASAFASARLALPGPEEKSIVCSTVPLSSERDHVVDLNPPLPLPIEGRKNSYEIYVPDDCEPVVQEPATPEPEQADTEESAIEDAFYEDPEEIPVIQINFKEFTQNLQDYMQANNMEIQEADMSKALVALNPEAASIPTPKLKNVSRLRTEHYVYELPDSHPLLEGFENREPDDPSSYLLAIWAPGETAQSVGLPEESCNYQETGQLCSRLTCVTCNGIREAQSQTVRGTLLIPCRTAMRGSFPLNGTYFQVNEVFADHDTSRNPIDVPREWIWNLPRRTVHFGTSVTSIFKGLTTEQIQQCFWRGFVCVRGFDRKSRAPRPLYARLHFTASKATKNKKPTPTATKVAA